jgi:hypothetical protein
VTSQHPGIKMGTELGGGNRPGSCRDFQSRHACNIQVDQTT